MAEALDDGRLYESEEESITTNAVIDPWCDACFEEKRIKIVVDSFCPECNIFMCDLCRKGHKKYPALWNHRIIRGKQMPKSQAEKPVKYLSCDAHTGNVDDYFCLDHSKMICRDCVKEIHHGCQTKSIPQLCNDLGSMDIQQLSDQIAGMKQSVLSIVSRLEENNVNIDCQREKLINEVKEMRDKIISKAEDLCTNTILKITSMCHQKSAEEVDRITMLKHITDLLEEAMSDIEKYQDVDLNPNAFLRLQNILENTRQSNTEIEDLCKQFNKTVFEFSCESCISRLLSRSEELGDIQETIIQFEDQTQLPNLAFPQMIQHEIKTESQNSKSIKPRVGTAFIVRVANDDKKCKVRGIVVTSNGTIFVADDNNGKLKVFTPDNKYVSFMKLEGIMGITLVNDSTAAVCQFTTKIRVLDVSDLKQLTVRNEINCNSCIANLTSLNGYLVVKSAASDAQPYVAMLSMDGNEIWTISTDDSGQILFKNPNSVAVTSNNGRSIIMVSDWEKENLTLLDASNGGVVKTVDLRGKSPHGITADNNGNIYIACFSTKEIMSYSADSQEYRCLVSGKDLRSEPRNLSYNRKTDEIFVCYDDTDVVDRFQI